MLNLRITSFKSKTGAVLTSLFVFGALVFPCPSHSDEVSVNDRPAVGLILLDNLMSGRSHEGSTVHYETLAPVVDSGNNLLIPAGSLAVGTVTRSKGSGMFGKRGQLDFTCEYVVLPNGDHVPLVGRKIGGSGANDSGATAAVTVLVSPLGLLIKGGTIKYDRGTPIKMFIADGAKITPGDPNSRPVRADFTLQDKKAQDIIGTVKGFDGDFYYVRASGQDQKIALDDISSISLDAPPADDH